MTSTTTDRLAGVTASMAVKAPCRVATTANITLSAVQTVDDIVLVAEDRVLVKNQTDPIENGIYIVTSGAWSRSPDWSGVRDIASGTFCVVSEGTAGSGTFWYISTTGALVVGTTSITITQMTVASASTFAATLLDDATAAAARLTLDFVKGADVASATALTLGADGNSFDVTGTTTVTSINTWNIGDIAHVRSTGVMKWTHHATNLILPNGEDITTTAGDELEFLEYASGTWRCINYQPAIGTTLRGQGTDIASASPLVLTNVATTGSYYDVTGTTGFSAMTVPAGQLFFLQFDGIVTITHGASIACPGSVNFTTGAGDILTCFSTAANVVKILSVIRAAGDTPDFKSTAQTVTADTLLDVAHGLGAVPSRWTVHLVANTTTVQGYSSGDEIDAMSVGTLSGTADAGVTISAEATNIQILQGATLSIIAQGDGNRDNITPSEYGWIVRAWK